MRELLIQATPCHGWATARPAGGPVNRLLVAILLSLVLHGALVFCRFDGQSDGTRTNEALRVITVQLPTEAAAIAAPAKIAPVRRQKIVPAALAAPPEKSPAAEQRLSPAPPHHNDDMSPAPDAIMSGPEAATQQGEAMPRDVTGQAAEQLPARPLYLENQAPPYPLRARKLRYRGTTQLAVLVGRYGTADELRLRQSSGHPVLDQAALDAVRRWKFAPGRLGGEAVAMWVTVPIRFELQ